MTDGTESRMLREIMTRTGTDKRFNSAEELTRLRSENSDLRATLKQAREALSAIVDFVDGPAEGKRSDVFFLRIGKARAAISAIEKVQP